LPGRCLLNKCGNDGLLTSKTEPNGNRFDHQFDANGRLIRAVDEEGGNWDFSRTYYAGGDSQTEVVTGEGDITSYLDHAFSTGAFSSTITNAVGDETYYESSADGLYVTKGLPCGMSLPFDYDLDPEHQFMYVTGITERAPSGLKEKGN
jgi:YD repeat-containing protein